MARAIIASGRYEEFAKGPGARHGRSNSLKWPWLYDKLRAKGYDKSKAAAISNSRLRYRKKGRLSVLPAKAAHNPKVLSRLADSDKAGKHTTKGRLTKGLTSSAAMRDFMATIDFACKSAACAPPPVGTGGSAGSVNRKALQALSEPDGGMTLSVKLSPLKTGFAVAIGGSDRLLAGEDAFNDGQPSDKLVGLVVDRIDAVMSMTLPPGTKRALGGWNNPDDGKIEINATVVFPKNRGAEAIKFAKDNDQIAMFSLHDSEVVMTGGTGGNRDV